MSVDVSFVIPCYRSSTALESTVREIEKLCNDFKYSYEIILVEDSTPDEGATWERLVSLKDTYKNIKPYRLSRNVGQQLAVICGFEQSSGQSVITIDDDGQHDISEVPSMLELLTNNDLVIASLEQRKVGFVRSLGTKLVRRIAKKIFKLNRGLSFSSYRAIKGDIARQVPNTTSPSPVVGFELLKLTSRATNHLIQHRKRSVGQSTYSITGLISYFSKMVITYSNIIPRICIFISFMFGLFALILASVFLTQYYMGTLTQPGFATLSVLLSTGLSLIISILGVVLSELSQLDLISRKTPRYVISESLD